MALSLQSLLSPLTTSSALSFVLSVAQTVGLSVTSWRAGGIGMTLAQALAEGLARHSGAAYSLAKGAYLDLAEGDWLTLHAKSAYDEDRVPATHAYYTVRLTSGTGAAPTNILAYSLWVATDGGLRFNSTNTGTVTLPGNGGTVDVEVVAESAGTDFNAAEISQLVTSIPGATVAVVTQDTLATDEESDATLRQRCRDKWGALAIPDGLPAAGYRYYALANDDVSRVLVETPSAGSVTVTVAGPTGTVTNSVVSAVQSTLDNLGVLGAAITVQAAGTVSVEPAGTVYVRGVDSGETQAAVDSALSDAINVLAIGGDTIGAFSGVSEDMLIDTIRSVTGVVRVVLTAGEEDMAASPNSVAVLGSTSGLTYTVVS